MNRESEGATSTPIEDGSRRFNIVLLVTFLLILILTPLCIFVTTQYMETPNSSEDTVYTLFIGLFIIGFVIGLILLLRLFIAEFRCYLLTNQPMEPVELPETFCFWCKKLESQWTNRIRLSTPQRAYCSVRCFAAGEHEKHIKIAKCSFLFFLVIVPIILMQLFPFTSDKFIGLLGLEVAISVYACLIIYMLVIGQNHRKRTSD